MGGAFSLFGLAGGGSGIGWIQTLRKLSVQVYSWPLFTLFGYWVGLFFFGLCGGGLRDWMDPNPSQALKLKFTLGHCLFLCLFLYLSRYVHVVFALISFAGSRESIYYVFAGRGGSWL